MYQLLFATIANCCSFCLVSWEVEDAERKKREDRRKKERQEAEQRREEEKRQQRERRQQRDQERKNSRVNYRQGGECDYMVSCVAEVAVVPVQHTAALAKYQSIRLCVTGSNSVQAKEQRLRDEQK